MCVKLMSWRPTDQRTEAKTRGREGGISARFNAHHYFLARRLYRLQVQLSILTSRDITGGFTDSLHDPHLNSNVALYILRS